jgi:hypothetical protein
MTIMATLGGKTHNMQHYRYLITIEGEEYKIVQNCDQQNYIAPPS